MSRPLRMSVCGYGLCKTTGCTPPAFDLNRNLGQAEQMLSLAKAEGADLAMLPETFALQHKPGDFEGAEPLDGKVISHLSNLARRMEMGIAAGHLTQIDGKRYNSLVLLDRRGKLAGVYHKAYPTISELEAGIAPGPGAVALETEFGRLGFAICYDLNFPELRLAYRDLNVDVILFGSAFRGGLQTRWWGYETRSFVVASCIDPQSVIVNPLGRIVAETGVWARQVTYTVNLDCEVIHLDYSNKRLDEARRRYGPQLQFEWSEAEGVMLVTAQEGLSIDRVIEEMGWEKVETYFARSRVLREQALRGETIPPGPPPW